MIDGFSESKLKKCFFFFFMIHHDNLLKKQNLSVHSFLAQPTRNQLYKKGKILAALNNRGGSRTARRPVEANCKSVIFKG